MLTAASDIPLVTHDTAGLLALLSDGAPRTRAQLVAETGLARSTVAVRLTALMDAGLVTAAPGAASSGGRPPSRVAFNPGARILVAVDLGATHSVVAITDLAGSILASHSAATDIALGPEPVLDLVLQTAERLLAETGRDGADLIGVGIGVPGPVEHSTGMPTNPPIMPGWDRFDVPAYVRRRFAVDVLVDNDVNLLALGEHATAWPDHDDLLFIKVATGIGAGIIAGGRLQRGARGSAGDLGHVLVPYDRTSVPHAEAGADLEAMASGPAIARLLSAEGLPATTSTDIVTLSRAGDQRVERTLRQAGRDLGEVLATCVNLLNPSVVVIGGSIARAGEHLLAGVREVVYGQSTPLATQQLQIVPATSGGTGGVLGAALMVADHVLTPAARA